MAHYKYEINIVSITAIMRGAVIHKIDSDSVKSRKMPKSYGVTYNVEFRPGHHPGAEKSKASMVSQDARMLWTGTCERYTV